MKKKIILPVLFVAVGASLLMGCREKGSQPEGEVLAGPADIKDAPAGSADKGSDYGGNTISVNSRESVTVVPDIAQVVYSVRTEDKTAAGCQQKNGEALSTVIAQLKELGVEESSIQTSDYYMNPVYNYSGNTARVTGYEAVATLTVSDLAIDSLDEILAKSVDGGINTIRSITYMASGYDESYQEALKKAVDAAHRKAQALAEASGRSVGAALNITETSGYTEARYEDRARANQWMSVKEELAAADTAGMMPGEICVEAGIIVEYQMY